MKVVAVAFAMLANLWITIYLLSEFGQPFFPGFPILITSLVVLGVTIYLFNRD